MDVYLLPAPGGAFRFFSPQLEAVHKKAVPKDKSKPAGRIKRAVGRIKRGYLAATRRSRQQEKVLKSLKDIRQITVHYPPRLSEKEAEQLYRELIEKQIRKHRRWLIVNGALIPFGVLLTIAPGPNVFLAFLAWRTLAHYQSHKGGKKAGELAVRFHADTRLAKLDRLARKRFVWNRRKQMGEAEHKLLRELNATERDSSSIDAIDV